jgi:hypothetical protein
MFVVFHVRSGPAAGWRRRLSSHQTVKVGGTEWADLAIPGDPRLAPVHFQLQTDDASCRLEVLTADGTMLVNGQPVRKRVLCHGDRIQAGGTEFQVEFEGVEHPQPEAPRPLRISFKRRRVAGVEILRGTKRASPPMELLEDVARIQPAWLLVDFRRAGVPLPAEADRVPDLLATLPEPLRRGRSLRCLRYGCQQVGLVGQLWGRDCLTCLFSSATEERLTKTIRDSLAAFGRPGFLRSQLHEDGRLSRLLPSIAAVLVETTDPEGWELFPNPDIVAAWTNLGLALPDPQDPAGE